MISRFIAFFFRFFPFLKTVVFCKTRYWQRAAAAWSQRRRGARQPGRQRPRPKHPRSRQRRMRAPLRRLLPNLKISGSGSEASQMQRGHNRAFIRFRGVPYALGGEAGWLFFVEGVWEVWGMVHCWVAWGLVALRILDSRRRGSFFRRSHMASAV